MKKCVLVRHGLTKGNSEKRYISRSDEHILPVDGNRVEKIQRCLDERLGNDFCLFSGSMTRCVETAQLLFPGYDIDITDELTEIDFGIFEGRTYEELKDVPEYTAWLESGCEAMIPGGESRDDFIDRSMRGFKKALALSGNMPCIIVCHGGNIMSVMSELTGEGYFEFRPGNLEGYELTMDVDDERISVVSYDRIVCGSDN